MIKKNFIKIIAVISVLFWLKTILVIIFQISILYLIVIITLIKKFVL